VCRERNGIRLRDEETTVLLGAQKIFDLRFEGIDLPNRPGNLFGIKGARPDEESLRPEKVASESLD
jgi:hypothetical protein